MESRTPSRRLSCSALLAFALAACASEPEPWSPPPGGNDPIGALRTHVVAIDVLWPDGSDANGFGFIVGVDPDEIYLATANHVVRRPGPNVGGEPRISTKLYERQGRRYEGRLLETYNRDIDLALITIPRPPDGSWQGDLPMGSSPARGKEVWFIGRDGDWYWPARPGVVNRVDAIGHEIVVDDLPVRPGTSGAPLIAKDGVVGMVIRDDGANTSAVTIDVIKTAIDSWGLPTQLLAKARTQPERSPSVTPSPLDVEEVAGMVTSVSYPWRHKGGDGRIVRTNVKFDNWKPIDPAQSSIRLLGESPLQPALAKAADPPGVDAASRLAVFERGEEITMIQHSHLPVYGEGWVHERAPASRNHYRYFADRPLAVEGSGSSRVGSFFVGFQVDYELVRVIDDDRNCLSFVTVRGSSRIEGFFCRPASEPIALNEIERLFSQISIDGVSGLG